MSRNTKWRSLTSDEINSLKQLGNNCEDWNRIRISGDFQPESIRRCTLEGEIELKNLKLEKKESQLRSFTTGLENSRIRDCRIEGSASVIDTNYLRGCHLEDNTLLMQNREIICETTSNFGMGCEIEVANEAGTRAITLSPGMLPTDIRLWLSFRGNKEWMEKFQNWSKKQLDRKEKLFARIASGSIIKNCLTLRNIELLGPAKISGAFKLKELTIQGTKESPVIIDEGSNLSWGLICPGARVSHSLAENFYLGAHSSLTGGARFFHSILCENSTISCCEVVSLFAGAFHEQHHNNSFLIATTLEGQSNIAAGATIGSNHNSRSADGEIRAGRGFWPGLNISLKHNSRFASFTLISGGNFSSELNITLPFSLVSQREEELQIMPAYWQQYNLYGLCRNSWKFIKRDKRKNKSYLIEPHWLAPDTVTEIMGALNFLQAELGNTLKNKETDFTVLLDNKDIENNNRPVKILKTKGAIKIYKQLIDYNFALSLIDYLDSKKIEIPQDKDLDFLKDIPQSEPDKWINLAGTPISSQRLNLWDLKITEGSIEDWSKMHQLYLNWMKDYPKEKLLHSLKTLSMVEKNRPLSSVIKSAIDWEEKQWEGIKTSRNKDIKNPFRQITFDSVEEKEALQISLESDPFIQDYQVEINKRIKRLKKIKL